MYSYTEFQGQTSLDKHGSIELNTNCETSQKPLWLVLVKLLVLMGMVAIGTAILTPALMQWMPLWKAALLTIGILQIYIGVSFFVRPRYNPDNMGWFGGMGNDPFQYSDNINRMLFKLHMLLGPGRFAADTMLDACALIGVARTAETTEGTDPPAAVGPFIDPSAYSQAAGTLPTTQPRPDRFEVPR